MVVTYSVHENLEAQQIRKFGNLFLLPVAR